MSGEEIPGDIRKLPQDLINKIAAGEVIQRPFNAVKELIENSLDAQSTSISVIAKDAGTTFLSVIDDGIGIKKSDFRLLCQRFTTSKIQSFEDLCSVKTFGFRGEALASISNVADLSITSRHKDSEFAYNANFINGVMVSLDGTPILQPHVCAGNFGTRIIIERLYYNNPVRKSLFSTNREEYGKVCSVVGRYAIQYAGRIAFSCKRDTDSISDVCSKIFHDKRSVIESVYKINDIQHLREFHDKNSDIDFEYEGLASLSTFSYKKYVFILFINDRLVDCLQLKQAISSVYSSILQKNQHPFFYISLKINPLKIDVNVHPTKQEIIFSNQTSIVSYLQNFTRSILSDGNLTLSVFSESKQITVFEAVGTQKESNFISTPIKSQKISAEKLNRSDHQEQSLESFFNNQSVLSISVDNSKDNSLISPTDVQYVCISKHPRVLSLRSIRELQDELGENKCEILTNVFQRFVFVGPVGKEKILIQFDVTLYLIDTFSVFQELFYQIILFNFGSFNYWKLSSPYHILNDNSLNQTNLNAFLEKRNMLIDYFSLSISDQGFLTHIPQLIKGLNIMYPLLQDFIKKLVEINWESEKSCLQSVSKAIAWLYASSFVNQNLYESNSEFKHLLKDNILILLKAVFIPQKELLYNGSVISLASLPELYKIFERC